jgi:hypothetical protein
MTTQRKTTNWTKWVVVLSFYLFAGALHAAGMDAIACMVSGCAGAVILM